MELKKNKCFVAYSSNSPSLSETLENAIEKIQLGQCVDVQSWKSLSVSGKYIIIEICKAIDACEIFICDLTTLNHNVLFELGFAIAKNKRVWILLDPNSIDSISNYKKFKILTTIGYTPYTNSNDIENAFYDQRPWEDIENTIYRDSVESLIQKRTQSTLFYIKCGIETEASIRLSQSINANCVNLQIITDDPNEMRTQPLSWYAKEINNAFAVVTHFLDISKVDNNFNNAKNSLVSGLAFGFGKELLMLAHEPYQSPIDYQDLLKTHTNGEECKKISAKWLQNIEKIYLSKIKIIEQFQAEIRVQTLLKNVALGDPIAENESQSLSEYFIETSEYNAALAARQNIFIGRKGYGKTAILFRLFDVLSSDQNNHVCIIKPVAYELEGILLMLKQTISSSETGFLIESFWKFLIYTELAKSFYEKLENKPNHYVFSQEEIFFKSIVSENEEIILSDFSIRLEIVVNKLKIINLEKTKASQRAKISELLHSEIIGKIRRGLIEIFTSYNKIFVLIDNLDKAWKQGTDFPLLSKLLLGLVSVNNNIVFDFKKHSRKKIQLFHLSILIFLRSDIFSHVLKSARERDKISFSRLMWNDAEVLLRIIEERIIYFSEEEITPSDVWDRFFCKDIKSVPIKKYLVENIIPRPRDIIYLIRTAVEIAVNRRHSNVIDVDLIEAQKRYSQYALESLLTEDNFLQIDNKFESLLYEFVAAPEIVNKEFIKIVAKSADIDVSKIDEIVELLCNATFLAREVSTNRYEFSFDEDQTEKLKVMSRKLCDKKGTIPRYKIHNAFHTYLEINKI